MKSLLLTTVSVLLIGLTSCNFQPQDTLSKELRKINTKIKKQHDKLSAVHLTVVKEGMDKKKKKQIDNMLKNYDRLFDQLIDLAEKSGDIDPETYYTKEHQHYYPHFFRYRN